MQSLWLLTIDTSISQLGNALVLGVGTSRQLMLVSQVKMAKRDQFQLPGMFAQSAWQNHPCCWRTCQALMGDACLGITCLRAAASSSHGLSPIYIAGPVVADGAVKDLLSQRQNVDRKLLVPPSRADFKAAKPSGKLSPVMDTTGMAALVCRHEFVAVQCQCNIKTWLQSVCR